MSTYPLLKLISDATMAFVCFMFPPGSQMIYFGGKKIRKNVFPNVKKIAQKNSYSAVFVCTPCKLVMQCHFLPQVPLSPLSDPML